jgi:hypothetical protein
VDPQLRDRRQLADGDERLVGLVQQVDYLGQVAVSVEVGFQLLPHQRVGVDTAVAATCPDTVEKTGLNVMEKYQHLRSYN